VGCWYPGKKTKKNPWAPLKCVKGQHRRIMATTEGGEERGGERGARGGSRDVGGLGLGELSVKKKRLPPRENPRSTKGKKKDSTKGSRGFWTSAQG